MIPVAPINGREEAVQPLELRAQWNVPLTILAVLGVLGAMRMAQGVLMPIVVSVLIAYALDRVVCFLERLGLGRAIASAVLLIIIVAAVGATGYGLRTEAMAVLDGFPEASRRFREMIAANTGKPGPIEKVKTAATEIGKAAEAATGGTPPSSSIPRVQLAEPVSQTSAYLWMGSMSVAAWAGQVVTIFFLVFFLLASGDTYKRKLLRLAGPTLSEKKMSMQILKEIEAQIGRFLLVQILTSALVSVVTWLALEAMGVNQPAIWGVAAGVLNSIPYFGAIMVSAGIALIAFLQFGTFEMALMVSGVTFVITALEGSLLTPALMGKAAKINQVAMFAGILFWSWMWGVVGMFLAVPILMVVRCIADRVEALWPVAEVLGERNGTPVGSQGNGSH